MSTIITKYINSNEQQISLSCLVLSDPFHRAISQFRHGSLTPNEYSTRTVGQTIVIALGIERKGCIQRDV